MKKQQPIAWKKVWVSSMHEATIASMILRKSNEFLSLNGQNEPLASIVVQIGEFRNVDNESLRFAFDCMKRDSVQTASAILKIIDVKAEAICSGDGHNYHPVKENFYSCTGCGGGIAKMIRGKELNLLNLEFNSSTEEEESSCLSEI